MEMLIVNALIGFWLLFFSAMAIVPFLVESKQARGVPLDLGDDQIISIKPVADESPPGRPLRPLTSIPAPGPDRRDAA